MSNEQSIIDPIPQDLILAELTPNKRLRMTNKSSNEIYIITAHDSPNILREIGRLREITFRLAGGGTGKACDLDEFDTCDNCYKQLIVWNPESKEIMGMSGNTTKMGNQFLLLVTCLSSQRSSLKSMPHTPLNSAEVLSHQNTKVVRKGQKVYSHWTIYGMDWEH